MKVFAFDRDQTVSIANGSVPLGWIKYLAHRTDHKVFATGNQLLKKEAEIPGVEEIKQFVGSDHDLSVDVDHVGMPKRKERLRLLKKLYPNADEHIVVDDANLEDLEDEGWVYYEPDDFVREYQKFFHIS